MVDLPRNIQDTDPEDFANELLRKVDNSLKCPICKAYFDAAMYSDCGHTFCAVCLRESLSVKQECPICRKPAKELSMKKNIMLEDTLILWQQARDTLLTLERLEAAKASKKRKRSASIQSIESDSNEAGPSSRPASTTVKKMKKRAESTQKTGDSTMTECPMCQNLVVEAIINQHIDGGCNPENDKKITRDSQRAKDQWSSVFGKSAKRKATPVKGETEPGTLEKLPRGSYDILKDKDLRRMLKEEGLPTDGETEAMKSRHKQWVIFWNSNVDRKFPKSRETVKEELKKWEREMASSRRKRPQVNAVEHLKHHKTDFDKLVQNVRSRKPKSSAAAPSPNEVAEPVAPPDVMSIDD